MLPTLFDGNDIIYHAQYPEFLRQYAEGLLWRIVLVGYQDKGFCIIGRIKNSTVNMQCVLASQRSEIRFIKCPDNAHTLLYNMGIYEFEIDATEWDMDSAFNPHKVSQESRARKKRREVALRNRSIYLDKFRHAYNLANVDERINLLVERAVGLGWLEKYREVSKKRFLTWFDKRESSNNKIVPAWVMKSATVLVTDKGAYPRDSLEMSVFACLWFAIHGPFDSYNGVKLSLPADFIQVVKKNGITDEWIQTVFNDGIIHSRYVDNKGQLYLESIEA